MPEGGGDSDRGAPLFVGSIPGYKGRSMIWNPVQWPSVSGHKSAPSVGSHGSGDEIVLPPCPSTAETVRTATMAALIVVSLHMGVYWGMWLLLGSLGCSLGYVPAWCPRSLP